MRTFASEFSDDIDPRNEPDHRRTEPPASALLAAAADQTHALAPADVVRVQRTIGNQATASLLDGLGESEGPVQLESPAQSEGPVQSEGPAGAAAGASLVSSVVNSAGAPLDRGVRAEM